LPIHNIYYNYFLLRTLFNSQSTAIKHFTARCYAVAKCSSVCLSNAGILSKRLDISSNFFHPFCNHAILVFPYPVSNGMSILRRGPRTPLSGASWSKMPDWPLEFRCCLYSSRDIFPVWTVILLFPVARRCCTHL